MSTIISVQSSTVRSKTGTRNDIFQDLPLIDRETKLSVMELNHSDKQIINELVYRFCRLITRPKSSLDKNAGPTDTSLQEARKVLILDMMGCVNPVRLATVLKRDDRRMRLIGIVRGCKINSTYVTLNSYLSKQSILQNSSLKLVVIYHDEFYILRTLSLFKPFFKHLDCQVILIVPRLDRQERDVLNLTTKYQILKCDFCVNRRAIGPAPPGMTSHSYQTYLNQIFIQRSPSSKLLPDRTEGELGETGLHLHTVNHSNKTCETDINCSDRTVKRIKSDCNISQTG